MIKYSDNNEKKTSIAKPLVLVFIALILILIISKVIFF